LEPNVIVYQAPGNWNDPDPAVRAHLQEHFQKTAQAASWIGCKIVSTIVPKAFGATPWRLNPRAAAQKEGFHLPDDYDFPRDWANLRSAYAEALKSAKAFGLKCSIECFIFSMVSRRTQCCSCYARSATRISEYSWTPIISSRSESIRNGPSISSEGSLFLTSTARIMTCSAAAIFRQDAESPTTPKSSGVRAVGYDGNLTVELSLRITRQDTTGRPTTSGSMPCGGVLEKNGADF
jgi:hypothetical protein